MPPRSADKVITDLQHRVDADLLRLLHPAKGSSIIAAVSGGVDSVAMLHILLALRDKLQLKLGVAHFNHQIRPTADNDARFVKRLAAKHKLEFYTDTADINRLAATTNTSLEMAGRAARYSFFDHILKSTSFSAVATAHSRTDNAETVILNLTRGGGINALAGIPSVRPMGTKQIIRPLLHVDKTELLQYVKTCKLSWKEDATNRDRNIPRNRVRQAILPELAKLNPRYTAAIQRSAGIVREIIQYLRPDIDNAKKALVATRTISDSVSIAIQPLKGYFGFLQSIALHEILRETFPDVLFGAADIDRVIELTERQTGSCAQIVGSIVALRDRATISISSAPTAPVASTSLVVGSTARIGGWSVSATVQVRKRTIPKSADGMEFVDADVAGSKFIIRRWQPGDSFIPLGMQSKKKVSDFFTDAKVPSAIRKIQLVMLSDKGIIWVCGHRIDQRVRVTENTKHLLKLVIERTPKE